MPNSAKIGTILMLMFRNQYLPKLLLEKHILKHILIIQEIKLFKQQDSIHTCKQLLIKQKKNERLEKKSERKENKKEKQDWRTKIKSFKTSMLKRLVYSKLMILQLIIPNRIRPNRLQNNNNPVKIRLTNFLKMPCQLVMHRIKVVITGNLGSMIITRMISNHIFNIPTILGHQSQLHHQ